MALGAAGAAGRRAHLGKSTKPRWAEKRGKKHTRLTRSSVPNTERSRARQPDRPGCRGSRHLEWQVVCQHFLTNPTDAGRQSVREVMEAVGYNKSNPAVKRILQECKELQNDASRDFCSEPLESNIFEWHFAIRGPPETDFEVRRNEWICVRGKCCWLLPGEAVLGSTDAAWELDTVPRTRLCHFPGECTQSHESEAASDVQERQSSVAALALESRAAASCLKPMGSPMRSAASRQISRLQIAPRGPQTDCPSHHLVSTQGGIYHGRILLPPEYPFKPPSFSFLTAREMAAPARPGVACFLVGRADSRAPLPSSWPQPNGRFEVNTKICLSISNHHPASVPGAPSPAAREGSACLVVGGAPCHQPALTACPLSARALPSGALAAKLVRPDGAGASLRPSPPASLAGREVHFPVLWAGAGDENAFRACRWPLSLSSQPRRTAP